MIEPDTIISLKKDQYRIIKEIGFGAYGVVWQAERISDGVMVAVKTIQTRNPENQSPFSKSFLAKIIEVQNKEIEFLRRLPPDLAMHNHILPLSDFGQFNDAPVMVLPLCSHSLSKVYEQRTDAFFSFDGATLLRWIWQIAAALKTVHALPGKSGEPGKFSHRDLKLQNVLVKDNYLYLSDYGTVKRIGQDLTFSLAGTPNWGAPEMLLPKKFDHGEPIYQFDESADLYPLGLLIHILATGNYTRAQGEVVDLLSMSGKPLAGAEKKFDKIGGLTERELQTLKIDMRRIFIDEDKTILAKTDDVLPEPELSLPDSEQIIAKLCELVNNLLSAKAELRPTARQVYQRAKRMGELLNPALDALNIEMLHKVKLGRPFLIHVSAKGQGLPADGRWLNITVSDKMAEVRTIQKFADNTWKVELEPLSKTGEYTLKAYSWVNNRKIESDEEHIIRLSASATQLWEQGNYVAALIKNPDQEGWLNALEHKAHKKRDFQRDYLAILEKVRKKHPDHTDINRRYWLNLKIERKKKATHPRRSAPETVSDNKFKAVFKLDKNRRPVKYVPITNNRFKVLMGGNVIKDNAAGLMWEQLGSPEPMNYNAALRYIKKLNTENFADYNDWRLPTVDELTSLLAKTKQNNGLHIDPLFEKIQLWCWSYDKRAPG